MVVERFETGLPRLQVLTNGRFLKVPRAVGEPFCRDTFYLVADLNLAIFQISQNRI